MSRPTNVANRQPENKAFANAVKWQRPKNQKLCYCRGTARRAMFVDSCYVSRGMGVKKVSNSISDLQGHSRVLAIGNGGIQ